MKNTKKTQKPTFIVVVAEYDEGGSDGLCIDNAIIYDNVDAVVDFITVIVDCRSPQGCQASESRRQHRVGHA